MRFVLTLCFLMLWNAGNSQWNPFSYFKEEKTVTYGLNNRRTQFLNQAAPIYGAHIGIRFGNRLTHTLTLNSTVFWVGKPESNSTELNQVRLNYAGLSEKFELFRIHKMSFNSYIHIGFGQARYRSVLNQTNEAFVLMTDFVFPLELGLHTEYALNDWSSLRLGAGYRYVLGADLYSIHGAYYKLGLGLNLRKFLDWAKAVQPVIGLVRNSGFN